MKKLILFIAVFICSNLMAKSPSHEAWTVLLKKNVSTKGIVNYKGFIKDSTALNSYLKSISENTPDSKWSANEQKNYWINAYNAFTVRLIIRNYPIKSINDVPKGNAKSPWDIKFFKIGATAFSLNMIEHEKLRKPFADARIHFALVCASQSCPILLNEAFEASKLDAQLDKQAKVFFADKSRNIITKNNVQISQLFDWYLTDFTTKGLTIIDFINQYASTKIDANAKISYLNYSWNLNE